MSVETEQVWLSTGDVARRGGWHSSTVKKWITTGVNVEGRLVKLQGRRIGRLRYTTEEWLAEFQAACNPDQSNLSE